MMMCQANLATAKNEQKQQFINIIVDYFCGGLIPSITCLKCSTPEPEILKIEETGGYVYTHYRCKGKNGDGCHDWIAKMDAETGELMVSSLSPCIHCGENTVRKLNETAYNDAIVFNYGCETCGLTATRAYNESGLVLYDLRVASRLD